MYLYTRATEAARTYYILLYTYKLYRYIISLYTAYTRRRFENIIPCQAFKFISRTGCMAVTARTTVSLTAAHNYKLNFILFLFFSTSINNMLFMFPLYYNIIYVYDRCKPIISYLYTREYV